jgi:hypothetical protein
MKLDKIKESTLNSFKGNEIQAMIQVIGGAPVPTSYSGSDGTSGSDTLDEATSGNGRTTIDGNGVDYTRN